ncbi:MAG TPA: prenyltransferase/squalene oxidase repeat-containing protein [Streptosporangiaceae bacterium]|jgi:hypothetical protein
MSAPETLDVRAEAGDLLAGLVARPWGQVSASVYETGRVAALAPWLTGHGRRLEFLLAAQRPDGGWGAPDGYALVPTLSATEAVLTEAGGAAGRTDLASAADRGLRMLFRLLSGLDAAAVPDTPAADLITVSLVEAVNRHLDRIDEAPPPGLDHWSDGARLRPPPGLDGGRNAKIQAALAAGADLPQKLLHALEVAGGAARGARSVRPTPSGTVGASPAATAAWLDESAARDPANPGRRFLEAVVAQHGGPVPCGFPITVFERAWVLANLARAGVAAPVPAELVAGLRAALGPDGTPAGEGLPADADTTSVALYALGLLGVAYEPDALWAFRTGAHFATWPGEDGFSVTTNAHVLEAVGHYAAAHPEAAAYTAAAAELAALLRGRSRDDGSWSDRWHASPYYATMCCALALDRFGGADARPAVAAAVRWLLATQRPDGSWGRWQGTTEETAYALQVLRLTRPAAEDPRAEAVGRGYAYLVPRAAEGAGEHDAVRLWHDKDLYRPTAIVRAAVLAALHLAPDGIRP